MVFTLLLTPLFAKTFRRPRSASSSAPTLDRARDEAGTPLDGGIVFTPAAIVGYFVGYPWVGTPSRHGTWCRDDGRARPPIGFHTTSLKVKPKQHRTLAGPLQDPPPADVTMRSRIALMYRDANKPSTPASTS
jgi:hypothetical protein